MAEKDDVLNVLGELAEKLGRDVPTGTIAELKVKLKEWQAELAAMDDDGGDGGGDGDDSGDEPGNTGSDNGGAGGELVQREIHKPADGLVRFTALATLHVNAVGDHDNVVAVVVKGQSARLPKAIFDGLQKRKLVKKV